ncbi:MAG: hypothetical protein R6U61_00400 [Thermoplasmata archaeon]
MKLDIQTGDVCSIERDFCRNCNNHYQHIRPSIVGVYVSNTFSKDVGDEKRSAGIIENVMQCSHMQFTELHKFEKHVDGFPVFRAKIDGDHIVYCIDTDKKVIIFLRYFHNYSRYKRFLEDDREILKTISRSL